MSFFSVLMRIYYTFDDIFFNNFSREIEKRIIFSFFLSIKIAIQFIHFSSFRWLTMPIRVSTVAKVFPQVEISKNTSIIEYVKRPPPLPMTQSLMRYHAPIVVKPSPPKATCKNTLTKMCVAKGKRRPPTK